MKYSSILISAVLVFSLSTTDASLSLHHRPSFSKKALVLMCDIPLYCTTQFFDYWIGSKNSFHKIRALLGYATDQRLPLAPFARNNNSIFLTNQLELEPYIQNDVNIAPQVLDHTYFKSQTNLSEPQLLMLLDKSSHAQTDIVQKIIANEPHLLASLKETLPKHHLQIIFDASIKKIEEKHYKPSDIEYDNLALLLNKNVVTSDWIKECYRHPWNYTLSTNQENRCESLENLFANERLVRLFVEQPEPIRDEFGLLALNYLVKQDQLLPTHVTALEIINKSMRRSKHRDIKKIYKRHADVFFDLFTGSFNKKDLKKLSNSSVFYLQRLLDYGAHAHKWPKELIKSLDKEPNYTAIRNLLINEGIIKALLGHTKNTSERFDFLGNMTASSLTARLLIKYAVCHCNDHDKNSKSQFETYNIFKKVGALLKDHPVYRKLKSEVYTDDKCSIQKMICRDPFAKKECDNRDRYEHLQDFFKANGTSIKYHKVMSTLLNQANSIDNCVDKELFLFALNRVDFTNIFARKLSKMIIDNLHKLTKKNLITHTIDRLIKIIEQRKYQRCAGLDKFLKTFIHADKETGHLFDYPEVLSKLIDPLSPNKTFATKLLKRYVKKRSTEQKDYNVQLVAKILDLKADFIAVFNLVKAGNHFGKWLSTQDDILKFYPHLVGHIPDDQTEDPEYKQDNIKQCIGVLDEYKAVKNKLKGSAKLQELLLKHASSPSHIKLVKKYAFDRKDYKLLKECIAKQPDTCYALSEYNIECILQNNDRQMLEIMCTDTRMAQKLLKVIIKKNILKSPTIFQEALLKLGSIYEAVSSQLIENFCAKGLHNDAKFEHLKAICHFDRLPSNILKKCCFWAAKNNNFERILPLAMIYIHHNKKCKDFRLSKNYTERLRTAHDLLYPAALQMLYRMVLPESSHQRMTSDLRHLDSALHHNSVDNSASSQVGTLSPKETDEDLINQTLGDYFAGVIEQDNLSTPCLDTTNEESASFEDTEKQLAIIAAADEVTFETRIKNEHLPAQFEEFKAFHKEFMDSLTKEESTVVETIAGASKQIVTGTLEDPHFYLQPREFGYQDPDLDENVHNYFAPTKTTPRSKL